ncbi:MAG: pyridoxamine 5'-phosphate oxidase family protein [Deltaproteobacteria bacterium]|nr:pyridoxamine 5'-phosphate oxidase family protein [Deltaproteobacteria bacterium]
MPGERDLRESIGRLFARQRLAVLSTQATGQPHGNLVAFASTDDLALLLFATRRDTAKYRRLRAEPRAALLVDDRSNREADFQEAVAVTALGTARDAEASERARFLDLYLARHPSLFGFATAPDCALLWVEVERYLVSGFREVEELRLR